MKKLLILAALTVTAAAALTGCASGPTAPGAVTDGNNAEVWTGSVETSAGAVDCVFYAGYYAGGVQCDWAHVGSATAQPVQDSSASVVKQTVNGQAVDCVTFAAYKGGGISCNLPANQK